MLSLGKRSCCEKHLVLPRCSPPQQRQTPAAVVGFPPPCSGGGEGGAEGMRSPAGMLAEKQLGLCVCTRPCSPGSPSGYLAGERLPARLDICSCSPLGSCCSLVEEEAHAPSPSHFTPGDATMSHTPQGSGGEHPWPPCPLGGNKLWCPGTCGSNQNVQRPDASSQQSGCQQMVLQPTLPRS